MNEVVARFVLMVRSRLVEVDDVVIIMTYVQLDERELVDHAPKVAVMNEKNEIIQMIHEKKEQ